MVLLQVLLQEGHRREFLLQLAGPPFYFDEALVFSEFLEGRSAVLVGMEDVCEVLIGEEVVLEGVVGGEAGHEDDVLEGELGEGEVPCRWGTGCSC